MKLIPKLISGLAGLALAGGLAVGATPEAEAYDPGVTTSIPLDFVFITYDGYTKEQILTEALYNQYIQVTVDYWVREARGAIAPNAFQTTPYSQVPVMQLDAACDSANFRTYGAQARQLYGLPSDRTTVLFANVSDCDGTAGTSYRSSSSVSRAFIAKGYVIVRVINNPNAIDLPDRLQVLAHELGHQFGMNHAMGNVKCEAGYGDGPYWPEGPCVKKEGVVYADRNNIMGTPDDFNPLNGFQKEALGIIQPDEGVKVIQTPFQTQDIEIVRNDTTSRTALQAIRVIDTTTETRREYSIDYPGNSVCKVEVLRSRPFGSNGYPITSWSDADGNFTPYRINASGSLVSNSGFYADTFQVDQDGVSPYDPCLSPDGERYVSQTGEVQVEMISESNGKAVIRLHSTQPTPICTGTLSIAGVPNVGKELTAKGLDCGTAALSYSWNGSASTATYQPTKADLGKTVSLTVTASKDGRSESFAAKSARLVAYFTDVPKTQRFYTSVNALADLGVVSTSGEYFHPDREVTRGEVAAYLYRLAGAPGFARPAAATFSDVAKTHTFSTEIEWAYSVGITKGKGTGTYKPDDAVTRAEVAAFLHRLELYLNGSRAFSTSTPHFTDVPKTHTLYWDVEWALAAGIATANPQFHPDRACLRDEFAALTARWLANPLA
ncbi:MAG: S-layer homology domain-containing protein [Propionibacteriaceae bacterium]|nr:S-layer homology domain-containing protein [Propionibacteriaceae bacterium]